SMSPFPTHAVRHGLYSVPSCAAGRLEYCDAFDGGSNPHPHRHTPFRAALSYAAWRFRMGLAHPFGFRDTLLKGRALMAARGDLLDCVDLSVLHDDRGVKVVHRGALVAREQVEKVSNARRLETLFHC